MGMGGLVGWEVVLFLGHAGWDLQVQEESAIVEWVVVQHHPRDVAQDFQDQAHDHADHEAPCFVVDS